MAYKVLAYKDPQNTKLVMQSKPLTLDKAVDRSIECEREGYFTTIEKVSEPWEVSKDAQIH